MTKIVSGTNPVALVQNGTVISTVVSDYVNKYRTFARKTAEAVIELSATMIEAKSELSDLDFAVFCKEVGLQKGDSTYKKLMKIGEHASRFRPFVHSLPNSWTTLYKLTGLSSDKFDRLVQAGTFTPFMTAKEIDQETGDTKTLTQRMKPDIVISVENLDPIQKVKFHEALSKIAEKYSFQFKATERLLNEIADFKTSKAA
jgi:hypothetical protein